MRSTHLCLHVEIVFACVRGRNMYVREGEREREREQFPREYESQRTSVTSEIGF